MSSQSFPTAAQRVELDLAQWRTVFGHLDALLDVPSGERMQAMSARAATVGDGAVASVLKDFCERTTLAKAPEVAGATGIAAISQALLGSTHLEAGQRCGQYRLIEPIGQGGMGSVWRAQRFDGLYQSEVAVKLLGSLALSAHARARFAREGDLLARLAHPHIARLLDAGLTDDHQRFLVLELVVGRDVATYVEETGIDGRAVVVLFRQIVSAIAFAHSQLIVHRDIKPGNVMVTTDGQVKLLDFGVAKLLDSDEDNDNLTRVVGAAYTEAYAAPEQLRGDAVSTRADIFSLGCLLHQLLTGESPRWSVAKRDLIAGAQPISDSPKWLAIPSDLRSIILKAIAIAPDERYETAAAFDDDLGRYLAGAPVRAQPATRRYRWRKFLIRNRWPVLAGTSAGLAILASLAVALWQLDVARTQRTQAVNEANRANQVTAFVSGLFRASDPRLASTQDKRTLTAQQLLLSGTERLKTELNDQPETKLALLGLLAEIWGFLGDDPRFAELNNERIKLGTERFGPLHPAVLEARLIDADGDLYSGNFDNARTTLMQLEAPVKTVFGEKSERYAAWLATIAELERRVRRQSREAVIARFEQSLTIFGALQSQSELAAIAWQNYSTALYDGNRLDDALGANAKALVMMERLKDMDLGSVAMTHERRAEMLHAQGKEDAVEAEYDRAIDLIARSFGAESTLYLNMLLDKAHWMHQQGRRDEAWAMVNQVFAAKRLASSDPYGVQEQFYVRGLMLLDEGKLTEAARDLKTATDGWRNANNNPTRLAKAEVALARAQTLSAPR